MRIRPDLDPASMLAPATRPAQDRGFSALLALANDSAGVPGGHVEMPEGPPPAEQWGTYGFGGSRGLRRPARSRGYADVPVGAGAPASPLNPSGVTTDPAFTVPGYTGREHPVPPGFYNIAYYQEYLAKGGTPLEGFPELDGGATLAATYGAFGDGRARATSFAPTPEVPDAADPPPCDAMGALERRRPPPHRELRPPTAARQLQPPPCPSAPGRRRPSGAPAVAARVATPPPAARRRPRTPRLRVPPSRRRPARTTPQRSIRRSPRGASAPRCAPS